MRTIKVTLSDKTAAKLVRLLDYVADQSGRQRPSVSAAVSEALNNIISQMPERVLEAPDLSPEEVGDALEEYGDA
jgi:hypothetical protein